jgi:hypothetical protein
MIVMAVQNSGHGVEDDRVRGGDGPASTNVEGQVKSSCAGEDVKARTVAPR